MFLSLIFLILPTAYAVVTLAVVPEAVVNAPIDVAWTRELGDPVAFDLMFLINGVNIGLAGSVAVEAGDRSGSCPVTFTSQGRFVLQAVAGNDNIEVATSSDVLVVPSPPSDGISTVRSIPADFTVKVTRDVPVAETSPTPKFKITPTMQVIIGVVGGLTVLIIIGITAFLVILVKRRRAEARRRQTFHWDLMVQHRGPINPTDIERGTATSSATGSSNTLHGTCVAGGNEPLRTTRQAQMKLRLTELEERVSELQGQVGMGRVLEQMKAQIDWLQKQQHSRWALGETDVPPHNYELYMQ